MSYQSRIEWTDATWNPVTGCTKVSAGCANCYAERMAARFPDRFGDWRGGVVVHQNRLDQPLRWRKPRRVFVCSMGDLFHENVPLGVIGDVLRTARACPQHTFMFLTKRPDRMRKALLCWDCDGGCNGIDCRHLWFGVSVEGQATADERIPVLLDTPAAVRFISAEPLLGPVDLGKWIHGSCFAHDADVGGSGKCAGHRCGEDWLREFHWVICGGESGPGARPMHPDWARSLRDQCLAAGVPFFFKQWGEWAPALSGTWFHPLHDGPQFTPQAGGGSTHDFGDGFGAVRVGKKAAGRLLDGREWNEYPKEG